MRKLVCSLCALILWCGAGYADEPEELGRIVVTPSRFASFEGTTGRSVTVMDGDMFVDSAYDAIPDVIGERGGIDIRRRGVEGIQADVAIRGTTFEQNSVLIDGITVDDPQTGHFNMDVPLTAFDLDAVEILRGPASSVHGPNAFGGTIALRTKRPSGERFVITADGGSFDYVSGGVSMTYPFGPINNRFSYEERRSTGYMSETEFHTRAFTEQASIDTFLGTYDFLFGYLKKDFGAGTFYSNNFPNEEEHTDTRFFRLSGIAEHGDLKVEPKLYMRRHFDKFALDRNRPGWQTNYHTTYVYGGEIHFVLENDVMDVAYGYELARDTIDSTNLQTHSRTKDALYIEIAPHVVDCLDLRAGFREDYSTDFGWQYAPSVSASLELTEDLRLRSSIGRAFRVPSFTDLYYNDRANQGNPNLRPESCWSYEVGCGYTGRAVTAGMTFFHRDSQDAIDWTRMSPRDPWRATNIGSSATNGCEVSFALEPRAIATELPIDTCSFMYSAVDVYAKHDYLSKYALDYLKQHITAKLDHEILGFANSWVLNYKKRIGDSGYVVVDYRLAKDIIKKGGVTLQAYLAISNLFDVAYSEQSDIPMPGRWITSGARLEF